MSEASNLVQLSWLVDRLARCLPKSPPYMDEDSPEWEVSQLTKFLDDPRVSGLEDREREHDLPGDFADSEEAQASSGEDSTDL